jgi:hypothetical protein
VELNRGACDPLTGAIHAGCPSIEAIRTAIFRETVMFTH